jgi:hypothetical protein
MPLASGQLELKDEEKSAQPFEFLDDQEAMALV